MNDTEFDRMADVLVSTDHGVTAEWIMRQLYHDSRDKSGWQDYYSGKMRKGH